MKNTLVLYAGLALLLTVATLYYQHATGPTYEKDVAVSLNGNTYEFELVRSHDNTTPCFIKLPFPDQTVSAEINYRRYPTKDAFIKKEFNRVGDSLIVELPNQPMAGKLQYNIQARSGDESVQISNGDIVVRFKGHVPKWILRIHILLMFASYFFAIFAALLAAFNQRKYMFWTLFCVVLLFFGGLVLGPIVQKYAFDVWWSGFPFGMDLTDNKLLIAFIVWLVAYLVNLKSERRWWIVAACVIHMIAYSIPHSTMGSEYDYESGTVGTSETYKDK